MKKWILCKIFGHNFVYSEPKQYSNGYRDIERLSKKTCEKCGQEYTVEYCYTDFYGNCRLMWTRTK
jgi:hypothetical protein